MSKTITQLTETTTLKTYDVIHLVDIDNAQDKKIKFANVWSSKPYAESYITGNTTDTVISVATTYYPITNAAAWVTLPGMLNKFTHNNVTGGLTYTGTEPLVIRPMAQVTVASVSAATDVLVGIGIYVDGSLIDGTTAHSVVGGNTAAPPGYRNIATMGLYTILTGEGIDVRITNETDTTNLEILDYKLSISTI